PRRADVDPQVGDLRNLVALVGLHQVNGLLADDPEHGTALAKERDALTDEHLRVPPADPREVEVPVIVDVGDLYADFVDMSGEHESRLAFGIDGGDGVAAHVALDLVRERLHFVAPRPSRRRFETGGPRSIEEALQEADGRLRHQGVVPFESETR